VEGAPVAESAYRWRVGGLTSALIFNYVPDDLLYQVVFGAGGIVGIVLGVLLALRPRTSLVTWSDIAGIAWFLAFGYVTVTTLGYPIEEVIANVWILAFGVAGAVVAHLRRDRPAERTIIDTPHGTEGHAG
jgi:hypothetical protein